MRGNPCCMANHAGVTTLGHRKKRRLREKFGSGGAPGDDSE
jgi:hypothetical protein